jgi:hypothetical protein
MASKPKPPQAIVTALSGLPRRCPSCWQTVPARTSESGGVTRLSCEACGWTERYLIVERAS